MSRGFEKMPTEQELQPKYATDLETLRRESKFEFFRSSGPGGQNINKVESGVRLRHIPSDITIRVEETPSQTQNRQIALERLQKRLEELNNPPPERKPTKVPSSEKIKRRAAKRRRSETKELRKAPDID